jgi:uncharacterized protein YdeI (YjbR/CyaY-like superfamily)
MKSQSTYKNEPILLFSTVEDLEKHMTSSESKPSAGFWLKIAKIGAPTPTISKNDAIEAALCCGWIDGQLGKFDEHYFLVRMTARRPGSRWSAKNRATAEWLAQQGRIRPAGQAEIEAAKRDGRWEAAYPPQRTATIPEDLAKALVSNKAAKRFFETLDRANRYAILYRVNEAKRPETRVRRIANFVAMLARGETIHPRKIARGAATTAKL